MSRPATRRRLRKPIRFVLYTLPVVLLITILIVILGRPNKAVIIQSGAHDSGQLDIESGVSTLKGDNFTLEYRTSLNTVTDITSQDRNAIEAYRVARSTLEDRRILVVTIKKLEVGGVTEESSYKMRLIQPATYKPSTETINGMMFNLMTRSDNQEVVAFTPHSGKLAVIAYSAGASDTIYQDALDTIKTFRWK